MGEKTMTQEFCEEVATKFSCSKRRKGKPAIQYEQVQSWFEGKRKKTLAVRSMSPDNEEIHRPSVLGTIDYSQESCHKSKAERIAGISELIFEAKSGRDDGWYDVAAFLNYRITCHGELEVRCRFAGFRCDHDEWVNVKRGVRERSIPLEPSECDRVKVGDRILCFRMAESYNIYCDAQVVEIERRLHDDSCCSCSFVVRYYLDSAEEQVDWTRICCRPT